MDVHSLKQYIINNEEKIELILNDVGFAEISDNFSQGEEYRCAWEDGGNPTSVRVRKDNLSANYFSEGIKGDIITLVQKKLNISFPKALRKISNIIDFEIQKEERNDIILPFGGFYKKINKVKKREYGDLKTYNESILDQYLLSPSKMFLKDGISCEVQTEYKIFYDIMTDRIGVPWRDLSGNLIGVMGRLNRYEIEEYESKWLPIIRFQKSKSIFGFSENYQSIQSESMVVISESEKGSLQLASSGVNLGLSLGGNSLSQFQANNIKSLFANKIIIGLDEGLDESVSVEMAEKLKMDTFFKNEVFYINDKNNKYLPKGSKMSPSDLPIDQFKKLVMECSRKV